MFRIVLLAAALLWSLTMAAAASSAGLVLVIANSNHDHLPRAQGADAVLSAVRRFEAAGFDADQGTDLSAAAMRAALDALDRRIATEQPERVVLVFAGRVLHSDQGSWLMGADTPAAPSLIGVDATGVRLETLLAIAGRIQGGAVVAIDDLGFPGTPGTGLRAGLPPAVTVPQGVSLIRGPAAQLANVLDALSRPGTNLRQAVAVTRLVRIEGFDPPWLTFLPVGHAPAESADRRAWAEAEELGTAVAMRGYLAEFPQGLFAAQAREALERLENTPERIEERLGLTRDERRAVQRHLALLGFDPRGIDGVFGPGSRSAIAGWQRREGLADTGFLDRDQVFRLAAQAARRAAELEEDERRRQAEQERLDRAFWRDTGAGRDESGMRAYLERFPQGIFAAIARERLAEIEARRRAEAQARDRAAWEAAQAADTVAAYRAYLAEYPRGEFAEQGAARIAELERPPEPVVDPQDAARAQEAALRLPRLTRVLIEQRLAFMGFDPGRIDGDFDRDTRGAIRRFQRANGFPVTGFLSEDVLSILLPGGLLRLLD